MRLILPEQGGTPYVPPIADFWKAFGEADAVDKTMLLTMLHTGARRSEVFRLSWDDVDFKAGKLPKPVLNALALLLQDIELTGPVRGGWPNYSKLGPKTHHCHLKKGRPTYVAVWIETDTGYEVEVTYAGTHEKAPY